MRTELTLAALRRLLAAVGCVVVGAGLVAVVGKYGLGWGDPRGWISFFSLSEEYNLPTWYSVVVLFCCGVLPALIAAGERRGDSTGSGHWWALALTFLYISLDELVQIHEDLSSWFQFRGGLLYYGWVVPGAALLLVWVAAFVPFVRRLPPRTLRRFLAAGAIYVAGGLVLELPLGWWRGRHGEENLVYALIDWTEETLEIAGSSLFLYALVDYVAAPKDRLTLGSGPADARL